MRAIQCAGAALLCMASAARSGEAAEVRWLAPPDCADARGTLEEAERLLGRPLSSVKRLDFDVRVTEKEGRWSLKLSTLERATGERRERVLTGEACDELTAAAAVAIAMVIASDDAAAPAEDEPSGPPAGPASAATPAVQAAAPKQAAPAERAPPALGVTAALAALGDVGALPNPALGAELGVSLDYRALRVSALGGMLFSSVQGSSGKGGDFDLLFGAVLACGRRLIGPAAGSVCAGLEAGQLSGTGTGVRNPRTGSSAWWAPRADLGVELPLGGSLRVFGRVGLTLPRVRDDFVVDDAFYVHRPAAVTGRLALGLELQLQ